MSGHVTRHLVHYTCSQILSSFPSSDTYLPLLWDLYDSMQSASSGRPSHLVCHISYDDQVIATVPCLGLLIERHWPVIVTHHHVGSLDHCPVYCAYVPLMTCQHLQALKCSGVQYDTICIDFPPPRSIHTQQQQQQQQRAS